LNDDSETVNNKKTTPTNRVLLRRYGTIYSVNKKNRFSDFFSQTVGNF